ncbi:C-terminal binding protein [Lysinibacter cavernae]|uniref:D-3-phosphoglycerate dehydrogenase n=1 Tax=Lysinibacter cavernae TaxID=1640652 RepID=A0A7X5R3L5_9MICO|nr:C-terminal binding protein [Lysinibacter cavernae]NIH54767.1 D-3-phosphoglycerate dehydrogenase [Lysinibacter cavernae]
MKKKIIVTDHAFKNVAYEQQMANDFDAVFECHSCETEDDTRAAIADADVVFVNFAPVTKNVLSVLKPGATVIRYGIGYDNVDIKAATELGISVANVPDYGVATVADHATASLLPLLRRIPAYNALFAQSDKVRPGDVGDIRGFRSTVIGLVGMGRIARAVVERLRPFGFSFIATDPYCDQTVFDSLGVERVTLDELAKRAHAISLHAPSTADNIHLIGADFLSKVQQGTVLVNTARGSLVDLDALAAAVTDGRIAGAALDVTDPEPLPLDSPLRGMTQVVLTPHAAFYDDDSLQNLQRLASEEAARALLGEELRCKVN